MEQLGDWQKRDLFITGEINEADPIWGQVAKVYTSAVYGWIVMGDRCGKFSCAPKLREFLYGVSDENKAKLTTWIVDQNRSGMDFPRVTNEVLSGLSRIRPLRFGAKIDHFFRYLNDRRYRIGDVIFRSAEADAGSGLAPQHQAMRYIEAVDSAELWGFVHAIQAAHLITEQNGKWRLTAEGLMRLDDVGNQGAANDQAFVAMWFGEEMHEPYHSGIVPGLADAGFKALRVDQKEHSNRIDDEIIAEIRRSRFVVADFTSASVYSEGHNVQIARGGVYYEAGFAQGLNMPVIWTVREDQLAMVHFDTRQFNHVTWSNPEELRVKLFRRVAAVLGHATPQ